MSNEMEGRDRHAGLTVFARLVNARPPPVWVWAGVFLLTLIAAGADMLVGPDLALSTVYLLPVAIAAWYLGTGPGIAGAAGCAAASAMVVLGTPGVDSMGTSVANGVLRLVGLTFVAAVVASLHGVLRQVRDLAGTDELTGLMNRRQFFEAGDRELARSQGQGSSVAVVCVDIDNLKTHNDHHGHAAGDAVLQEFASTTLRSVRASDLVGRIGGDEFCLLLPNTDIGAALSTMDRIMLTLESTRPHPIRLSAGACAGVAEQGVDLETVLNRADELMYQAKRSGRGQMCCGALPDPGTDAMNAVRARSSGGDRGHRPDRRRTAVAPTASPRRVGARRRHGSAP